MFINGSHVLIMKVTKWHDIRMLNYIKLQPVLPNSLSLIAL